MAITLTDLLDTLTIGGARSCIVDEITHTGKAGTTRVERWPLTGCAAITWSEGRAWREDAEGPWVWRLMWRPATARWRRGWGGYDVTATRIAYGVADSKAEATTMGRAEARRLAKERRATIAA